MVVTLIVAVLFLSFGVGLIYWINRRRFYRRNVAGLEGFSSFEASVFIHFLERIGKLLAYILIFFSIILFFLYSSEKKKMEKNKENIESQKK
nr:hypothetical protein [Myroides odoratimimus]